MIIIKSAQAWICFSVITLGPFEHKYTIGAFFPIGPNNPATIYAALCVARAIFRIVKASRAPRV
jgi:hypothetical protein